MIRSMTAFARSELRTPFGRLACEIRGVNHRYLDLSLRLPETLRGSEADVREQLRAGLDRGKVECSVRLERPEAGSGLAVDPQLLAELVSALDAVRTALGDAAAATDPLDVLRWPGVIRDAGMDPEAMAAALATCVEEALTGFIAHREREGALLAEALAVRLAAIETITAEVKADASALVSALRDRLRERARTLTADLDPTRLEQEVALLAQKADVAEELDRLGAHVAEVRQTLSGKGAVGRRLDFLAQELNREANTLASKATGAAVASRAVDLKVLIEQMREQIQNLE
ncbi:MAG: YicC family protein [Gammaproteobacteria bacterium]|nr:YicC family protein [Gammaproteobacteria bacterium]